MKVCYIVSNLKNSGPINILYNTVKYLDRDLFEPSIITLTREKSFTRINDFKLLNIPIYTLDDSKNKGGRNILNNLKWFLAKIDPDIIHSHGLKADFLNSKLNQKYIKISTAHNNPYLDYQMKYGFLRGRILALINIISFKKLNTVIACSKSVADYLGRYKISLQIIQNGVDLDIFHPIDEVEKNKLKKKLKISDNKKIFVSIGSLIKRKNPLHIINAMKQMDLDNYKVYFLGNGPLKSKCLEVINNDDRFEILGHVDNPHEYLMIADYFISASKSEGLPNSVLESLAVGVPVVLSDISSHKEILNYNENAGVVFKLNNAKSLQEAILKLDKILFEKKDVLSIVKNSLNAFEMSSNYQKLYLSLKSSL